MATVSKAYDSSLGRYVALKVLHPASSEELSFKARFQRKACLVAMLEHETGNYASLARFHSVEIKHFRSFMTIFTLPCHCHMY
jgi:serine/threonine protein kinase